jgi:thiamine biosynthesis protein ThiI
MQKIVLIRYDEIHLKGRNRGFFEQKLLSNLRCALDKIPCVVDKIQGRYTVSDFEMKHEAEIAQKIACVFGVRSYSFALVVKTDIDVICAACLDEIKSKNIKTFRITVNRADKTFFMDSVAVAKCAGAYILSNGGAAAGNDAASRTAGASSKATASGKGGAGGATALGDRTLKVDLSNADFDLKIDIRENGKTYIFSDTLQGLGGMPVGVSGTGLTLLSGGIDSPVAAFMMAKRGMTVDFLHFHSFPYTSERARRKVIDLKNVLQNYTGKSRLFCISATKIQEEINAKCPSNYHITLLRRFMMRLAKKVAAVTHAGAIITGESLAQVASQTLESIIVSNDAVDMPVFRPLIGFDKEEIVRVAKKIDTYDISVLPYEDCCTVFLPKNPSTKPKLSTIKKLETALDIEELEAEAMSGLEIL